ncbi:MAG: hypothetical protein IT337_03925 [Thermomicrobiales bacterium]|nr:hypothetical protein [Thermomicrobiales bacterium]
MLLGRVLLATREAGEFAARLRIRRREVLRGRSRRRLVREKRHLLPARF